MSTPRWQICERADVPSGDAWLGATERRVHDGLAFVPRREDWRLGRWTAKTAVAATLRVRPEQVEIVAAPDGAPEAWIGREPAGVSISLSHRGGRGLAVVVPRPAVVGCDLELVEPRSDAFVSDWFAPEEQAFVASAAGGRDLRANLVWTAKEAASKVRREGLRLDVRRAVVVLADPQTAAGDWHPLTVRWDGGASTAGWWRADAGWVMTIAAAPACGRPVP